MDVAVESISSRPDFVAMRAGEWMNGFTPEIARTLSRCEDLCFRLNATPPSLRSARDIIVREIVAEIGGKYVLHSPFYCDFGFNIRIGENFVGNYNLTILDEADVTIGDNVFIGPNTTICTIIHSIDAAERNAGIMQAKPVTIGNNVWIASNVVILPGVTVGEGAVVGAGSVVTKDVSPFTVVAGNPAKTIRNIRQAKNFS